jgi:hypothetical protein
MEDWMNCACNSHGRGKKDIQNFSRNSEEKSSLGSTWCRWENNIKMGLNEIECGDVDFIQLSQNKIH